MNANCRHDENDPRALTELAAAADADLAALGGLLDAETPAEALDAARRRMDAALAARRWRRSLRWTGALAAAALLAVVLLPRLWLASPESEPAAAVAVVVYVADDADAAAADSDAITADDLAQGWMEYGASALPADSELEIWSGGLGLYADAQGIFTLADFDERL